MPVLAGRLVQTFCCFYFDNFSVVFFLLHLAFHGDGISECASQHLLQRNNSEQIEKVWLIFKRATAQRELLITQLNRISINFVISYNLYTSVASYFALYSKQAHTLQNSPSEQYFCNYAKVREQTFERRERMNDKSRQH